MRNRAQATLEFTLIFIITVALLGGLLGLWKWSSDNIIKRQLAYNASRKAAGFKLGTPYVPGSPPKVTTVLSDAQALLDALRGAGGSFSVLSPEQLNAYLDSTNQAITDIQGTLATVTSYRDTWKEGLDNSRQKETEAQQVVSALEAEIAEAEQGRGELLIIDYDEGGEAQYETYAQKIARLEPELSKARNGYYTAESCSADECTTTYDSSNTRWMNKLGSREEWAQDYWFYTQYGVSEGNNLYRLYNDYTPGLLDWQARATYAQEQYTQFQSHVESANSTLSELTAMRDKLQAAKDSKTL